MRSDEECWVDDTLQPDHLYEAVCSSCFGNDYHYQLMRRCDFLRFVTLFVVGQLCLRVDLSSETPLSMPCTTVAQSEHMTYINLFSDSVFFIIILIVAIDVLERTVQHHFVLSVTRHHWS